MWMSDEEVSTFIPNTSNLGFYNVHGTYDKKEMFELIPKIDKIK